MTAQPVERVVLAEDESGRPAEASTAVAPTLKMRAKLVTSGDVTHVVPSLEEPQLAGLKVLLDPAYWRGRGAVFGADPAIVFGVWRFGALPPLALLLWLNDAIEKEQRSACVALPLDAFVAKPVLALSSVRSSFNHLSKLLLKAVKEWETGMSAWFSMPFPQPSPIDAQSRDDAASLLPQLLAIKTPQGHAGINAESAIERFGSVQGPRDEQRFWHTMAALADAMPASARPLLSAAFGFEIPPAGILVTPGENAQSHALEASVEAFDHFFQESGVAPENPGSPYLAAGLLRRWLRALESPKEQRLVRDFLLADDFTALTFGDSVHERAKGLLSALCVAEAGAVSGQEGAQPVDPVGAARLASFFAVDTGSEVATLWSLVRAADPGLFYWSALSARRLSVIDDNRGRLAWGPIQSLRELERLLAFDLQVSAALEPEAPSLTEGPAFVQRLQTVAALCADLLVDDPEAFVRSAAGTPLWLSVLAPFVKVLAAPERKTLIEAIDVVARAGEILTPEGPWRASADILFPGASWPEVDIIKAFSDGLARCLDRGVLKGADFWRRAIVAGLNFVFLNQSEVFQSSVAAILADKDAVTPGAVSARAYLQRQVDVLQVDVLGESAVSAQIYRFKPVEPSAPPKPTASAEELAAPQRIQQPPVALMDALRLAQQRAGAWRRQYDSLLSEGRDPKQKARHVPDLSPDDEYEIDERAFAAIHRVCEVEWYDALSQDHLNHAIGEDLAWTCRQLMSLQLEAHETAETGQAPNVVREGWETLPLGDIDQDLDRPEHFFLFFAGKSILRNTLQTNKPAPPGFCLRRILISNFRAFSIGSRQIKVPKARLHDHIYGAYPGMADNYFDRLTNAQIAGKFDRSLLFLACLSIGDARVDYAPRTAPLWQSLSLKPEHVAMIDPCAAVEQRLSQFVREAGDAGKKYADVFYKINYRSQYFREGDGFGRFMSSVKHVASLHHRKA